MKIEEKIKILAKNQKKILQVLYAGMITKPKFYGEINKSLEEIMDDKRKFKEDPPWYGKLDNCSNACTFIDDCWNCKHISEWEKHKYLDES